MTTRTCDSTEMQGNSAPQQVLQEAVRAVVDTCRIQMDLSLEIDPNPADPREATIEFGSNIALASEQGGWNLAVMGNRNSCEALTRKLFAMPDDERPETEDLADAGQNVQLGLPFFMEEESWDLANPSQGCFITFLQGKDKHVEGAIITDLPATLYMGGKLILLPENTLQDLSATGQADQQVVEAVNEVVNNLSTLFNDIDKNPHVAPTKTFAYDVPSADDHVGETVCGPATMTLLAK